MKKSTWRKHHKWFGLIMAVFLILFCVSGIILNHRQLFSDCQISRGWLPETYRYRNWNNGLVAGNSLLPSRCVSGRQRRVAVWQCRYFSDEQRGNHVR